jgi:thiamine-monophosphate kinase
VPLGPGAEFDAIRELLEQWGPLSAGAGDDAALLTVPAGARLVASTDATVEDVHFRDGWITPTEIGYRAVTAALSDLAAMGAAPLGVLTAWVVPASWRSRVADIAHGVGEAVARAGTVVMGGNLSDGSKLAITSTVLGSVRTPLRRDGVRVGDALYVTGRLGGVGAALAAFLAGNTPGPEHRERFARPVARLSEGEWLATYGAHAAVDISDGLVADAAHLAAAGRVGIELDLGAIPLAPGVTARAALVSGEEYELLVAAPGALDGDAFQNAHQVPLTMVGRVVARHPGQVVVLEDGHHVAVGHGHDQFLA